LAKILYFADSVAFVRTGKPITGTQYKKLPYGPVPDELTALLEEMASSHVIAMRDEPYFKYTQIKIFALKEPDLNRFFSASDIALIDEIIHEYWNVSAADISSLSHGMAWETTPDNEAIPYEASLLSDEEITLEEMAHLQELAKLYGG
jgi:hypothetical protein